MKKLSPAVCFFLFMLVFAAPLPALAAAQITEIMYNLPGNNAGRQWIEVVNTGSQPVDLTGYAVFENGTNHTLKPVEGTHTLAPSVAAILADNPQDFLADTPNFSGTLFKSAFTLTSKGETLALKDSSGVIIDSVSYDSSMGANGDGNSLHRDGSSFVPGPPSPGVFPDPKTVVSAAVVETTPSKPIAYTGTVAAVQSSESKSSSAQKSAPEKSSAASPNIAPTSSAPVMKSSEEAAAASSGLASASLVEIVAGSAAFGVVVLGGLLLSSGGLRLRRQEAPATEGAAEEFEIIDSPPKV